MQSSGPLCLCHSKQLSWLPLHKDPLNQDKEQCKKNKKNKTFSTDLSTVAYHVW